MGIYVLAGLKPAAGRSALASSGTVMASAPAEAMVTGWSLPDLWASSGQLALQQL